MNKEYIVQTSKIVVENYTIFAKSEDDARNKWSENKFKKVEKIDELSQQIEQVWEE